MQQQLRPRHQIQALASNPGVFWTHVDPITRTRNSENNAGVLKIHRVHGKASGSTGAARPRRKGSIVLRYSPSQHPPPLFHQPIAISIVIANIHIHISRDPVVAERPCREAAGPSLARSPARHLPLFIHHLESPYPSLAASVEFGVHIPLCSRSGTIEAGTMRSYLTAIPRSSEWSKQVHGESLAFFAGMKLSLFS